MIVAKVFGLPPTEEAALKELYTKIAEEIGTKEIDLITDLTQTISITREDDSVVRVGEEIIIEIFERSDRAETVQKQLAMAFKKVVCVAFPNKHIEWSILQTNLDQGYWPSFRSEILVKPVRRWEFIHKFIRIGRSNP